jgi:uncharacterized protein YegL
MTARPGGRLARRPLHFFFLVDCSGSMGFDGKIQALNTAIREAIPHMRRAADENANADVFVRVVRFSDGADWHVQHPTPIEDFTWHDVEARGVTDMGEALRLVAPELNGLSMPDRALPPVLVLISDGQPTDDFSGGLQELLTSPWGEKSVRMAVAIGRDADQEILQKFIAHLEYRPVSASNPEALVERIKWASTAALKAASSPTVGQTVSVPAPAPPAADPDVSPVW